MLTRPWHPFAWLVFFATFANILWLGAYASDHQWYMDWNSGLRQHLGWHLVLIWCQGAVIMMAGFALFRAAAFTIRVALEQHEGRR